MATLATVILRNELRVVRNDQGMFLILIAMPVVLMAFITPLFRTALHAEGYAAANGSEQAVPGMAVMFAFFIVGNVGFMFFREHGWGTWERLRASTARTPEIIAGKVLPLLIVACAQQLVIFLVGWLFLGLPVRGSPVALGAIALSFCLALVAFGVALAAVFNRIEHLSLVQTVGTLVFAGFGGALAPTALLPGWVQAIGRFTPSYWAIQGYRNVLLEHDGLADVAPNVAILVAVAAAFTAVALLFFRVEESKQFWT